jgi:hypothetical protein
VRDRRAALADALCDRFDWGACEDGFADALAEAGIAHGVDGLVWERLGDAVVPAAVLMREALDERVRAAATRELLAQRELRRVLASMAAAGVPALLMKGSALAYSIYHQPWLRPRTDSDVLVNRGDLAAASRALEEIGYRRTDALSTGELVSHQVAFERTDAHGAQHVIDLHWKVVNPQMLAESLTFDQMRAEAAAVPALGPDARIPSRVHAMAIACVHRLAHHQGNDRLIWLYDIDLLAAAMTRSEWQALLDLARRQRIAGLCADGLRAARSVFETRIPADIEQGLSGAISAEPSRVYLEGPVRPRDVLRSDLAHLRSQRARARLLLEHAFPPASFMQQRYGTRRPWVLPALYVHRLVTGASKWVRS